MRISDWSSDVCSSDLVIKALVHNDSEGFYSAETESRRRAHAPPFGRFAAIVVSSEKPEDAQATARLIGKASPKMECTSSSSPAPAPPSVLRGRHRTTLLIPARRAPDDPDSILMGRWVCEGRVR